MRAQDVNTSAGTCLNQLNITVNDADGNNMFDISVSLAYSFEGIAPAGCTPLVSNTRKNTMVLIDATVTDHDLSTEEIRIHKRSWQEL